MSFKYIKNKTGFKTVPCGTPIAIAVINFSNGFSLFFHWKVRLHEISNITYSKKLKCIY